MSSSELSTFDRSCNHWSETGRDGMAAFYKLAAYDYRLLAEQLDWSSLFRSLQSEFGSPIRLLDVACGSGQFPNALLEFTDLDRVPDLSVTYDLLDPSAFSINVAREKLRPPFTPGAELQCTAQDLQRPSDPYAIEWATHALYCVPSTELQVAIEQMRAALAPQGLGFIAHASQSAHYIEFQKLYLRSSYSATTAEPFCSGEQVLSTLQEQLGDDHVHAWTIDYEGQLPLDDRATAELYLQRCLFDDAVTLDQMLADEHMGDYVRSCMDSETQRWRFSQRTWLIFYGEMATTVKALRR
jgi:ubiquinone/menaquinone biosynthesis C-methylase UbiE